MFTERGSCVITGRSDATLNRGGVRLGTGEVYSVVEGMDEVVESLVVHIEDPGGGPGELILFVTLADGRRARRRAALADRGGAARHALAAARPGHRRGRARRSRRR